MPKKVNLSHFLSDISRVLDAASLILGASAGTRLVVASRGRAADAEIVVYVQTTPAVRRDRRSSPGGSLCVHVSVETTTESETTAYDDARIDRFHEQLGCAACSKSKHELPRNLRARGSFYTYSTAAA